MGAYKVMRNLTADTPETESESEEDYEQELVLYELDMAKYELDREM